MSYVSLKTFTFVIPFFVIKNAPRVSRVDVPYSVTVNEKTYAPDAGAVNTGIRNFSLPECFPPIIFSTYRNYSLPSFFHLGIIPSRRFNR